MPIGEGLFLQEFHPAGNGGIFACERLFVQMLFDKNQNLKRAMNVSLTPQTYIVDGNGKIVYSHSGYTPGSELELLEKLKELQKK